ncbi:Transmembrane protein 19 [Leucoagaricus sp. SymC.cos]|nr:Transmembrane protein 19 [Leucoagaricus sp. SymC.cos]
MQIIPLILALFLSLHGFQKKSLSPGGALTAFLVGYGSLSGGLWAFGNTLIGFYLIGSRATKYGKQRKAKLEDGYHEAGYRTGWQVLCNSAAGIAAAAVWNGMFVPNSVHAWILERVGLGVGTGIVYGETVWCPLDKQIAEGWSRALVFAAVGHYGCCLGDTLASELGILSRGRPRLVTTFQPVPPGTNGGMSVGGTLASVFGGVLVGVLTGLTLVSENARCRDDWSSVLLSTLLWGAFSGFFGSLIDSLMGATLQQTRYSEAKKVILQDESKAEGPVKVISGFNILTNNQACPVSFIPTDFLTIRRSTSYLRCAHRQWQGSCHGHRGDDVGEMTRPEEMYFQYKENP